MKVFRASVMAALMGFALEAQAQQPPPKLPIAAFAQLERNQSAEIAPDGKRFVTLSNYNGRYSIAVRPLTPDGGIATLIPAPGEAKFEYRWVSWANATRLLIGLGTQWRRGSEGYYSFRGTTRETRLMAISADATNAVNAIRPIKKDVTGSRIGGATIMSTAQLQDRVIDWLPNDPDSVLVAIQDDQRPDAGVMIRKVDVNTGNYSYVLAGMPNTYHYDTDQQSTPRLGWASGRSGDMLKTWIVYLNPETGLWVKRDRSPLTGTDYGFVGFFEDPRYAYVFAPHNGRRSLIKWDMVKDSADSVVYSHPDYDVEGTNQLPGGNNTIIGVELSNGTDVYFDPAWDKRIKALNSALKGYNLTLESATADQSQYIVRAESDIEPGLFYLFDSKKRTLEVIEYAYAGIKPEQMAPMQTISHKARDGLEIEAVLTIPLGATGKAMPTVVLPHGGPWTHDRPLFDWQAQFLANRGYLVIQPNFRGSSGYGKAFLDAGDGQWGLAMQDDITDAVDWLARNGHSDPRRICIVGGSYGGYAALMGTVKTPALFRCAASLNGVSDLPMLVAEDTGGLRYEEYARRIGDAGKDRARLVATSPLRNIGQIKTPILLAHAKDDLRVEIKQSRRMHEALVKAGKESTLVEIERGEHWLENQEARVTWLTALESFLAKHLTP